jgi:hypothetical protein
MTRLNRSKLNSFMSHIPSGVALTSRWLREEGISSKLAWWYVRSGWLERIGDKLYKRSGDLVKWVGAIAALQHQLHLPIHVGAKTALELLGKSHFVSMQGIKQVILFAHPGTKIPHWLENNNNWEVYFSTHRGALFTGDELTLGIVERLIDGINIFISSPERAAMEVLYMVPNHQPFDEVVSLMENLSQMRPDVVQMLLERCNSIKVKRMFLHLAERLQYEWLSEIDIKKINLGRGKLVVGKGGDYDSKYQLSVPKIIEE